MNNRWDTRKQYDIIVVSINMQKCQGIIMIYLIVYLVIINLVSFWAYRTDKRKSEKGQWRMKEITLLSLSLFGGGIGSMFGMSIYRHKTKKMRFLFGVPFLTIVSIIIIWLLVRALSL